MTRTQKEKTIHFHFMRKMGIYYNHDDLLYFYSCFQKCWRYNKLMLDDNKSYSELEVQMQIEMWKGTELREYVDTRFA